MLTCLALCWSCPILSIGQTPNDQVSVVDLDKMTNQVFLTADDFKYNGHGLKQAHIDSAKLAEALLSDESRPESRDTNGHWGATVEGLRLSLRLSKFDYTNGEPIVARVLVRNVVRSGEWQLTTS